VVLNDFRVYANVRTGPWHPLWDPDAPSGSGATRCDILTPKLCVEERFQAVFDARFIWTERPVLSRCKSVIFALDPVSTFIR
jgi:hypothetical protein